MTTSVGILALQGGFALHAKAIAELGVATQLVRRPEQLAGLTHLVIPGGESSALLTLMAPWDFIAAIRTFIAEGGRVLGTCAGAILLAKTVTPTQATLGVLDISVARNAYGRQRESFQSEGEVVTKDWGESTVPLVFIRAPKITAVGAGVTVLVQHGDDPVLVQQGGVMAATFHPELSPDSRVLRFFLQSDPP